MSEAISVDYLVVGAGAMGLAFVDELVSATSKTVAIVDRYSRPGGHWTTVYSFVRLHQPSVGYGVNSRRLGEDRIDEVGWNKGLMELASGDEVCAYYTTVMHTTFLPSGRVKYYPQHEYKGEGRFESLLTGKTYAVSADTKIVDAAYMQVDVPSMRPPPYQVDEGVEVITPNDLPKVSRPYKSYTVVGAGKTGIDACLWLLSQGIDSGSITWIMPRDSWLLDRANLQPVGEELLPVSRMAANKSNEAVMTASSPEDLLLKLEASRYFLRLDNNVWPSKYKCATVTQREFEAVKGIANIIRQGRVQRLSKDEVTLTKGTYSPKEDTLYIDCAAGGLPTVEGVPIFKGKHITLQPVRFCQQVFSAAFIGHVEATYDDEKLKNQLAHPVPLPDVPTDWLSMVRQTQINALQWAAQPKTAAWLAQARLDWFKAIMPKAPEDPEQAKAFYQAIGTRLQAVIGKLGKLMEQLPDDDEGKKFAEVHKL